MRIDSNIGFETACKRAGIMDFTFHDLRHTFATHFLEQHPDKISILSDIMGHSTTFMTERYAHTINRAKHRAMEEFGGFSLRR